MLACARLGAIHSLVFGGFASKELATRINHAQVLSFEIPGLKQIENSSVNYCRTFVAILIHLIPLIIKGLRN
jgi:hypothetical protein